MISFLCDLRIFLCYLLIILIATAGCSRESSAPKKTPNAKDAWDHSTWVDSNYAAVFVPLPRAEKWDPQAAKTLWQTLWKALDEDPESRKLLKQLYGGITVQVAQLDGKSAFDETAVKKARPKRKQPAVLLFVHAKQPGRQVTVRGQKSFVGTFSLGRVMQLKRGARGMGYSIAKSLHPNDLELMYLVANDYLIRHKKGWQLTFQAAVVSPRYIATSKKTIAELHLAVRSGIEKHLDRFKENK